MEFTEFDLLPSGATIKEASTEELQAEAKRLMKIVTDKMAEQKKSGVIAEGEEIQRMIVRSRQLLLVATTRLASKPSE